MADVVHLKQPCDNPRIWVCDCGCSTFELVENGNARCASCFACHGDGGWTPDHMATEFDGTPFRDVSGNGAVDFARHRLQRCANSDDAVLIAVADQDGSVHVWSAAETAEQLGWARAKLRDAIALLPHE